MEQRSIDGKGKAVFATKSYSEGDLIFQEAPLLTTSSDTASTQLASTRENAPIKLPPQIAEQIKAASPARFQQLRQEKVRGMVMSLASFCGSEPSEELKESLLSLFHPDDACTAIPEMEAKKLADIALSAAKTMAKPGSALSRLLGTEEGSREALRLMLVYSCNSFEGGRIYDNLSRVNHSCNPNAVVVQGENEDESLLKAACDIRPGDEVCISYLGKYLFASFPIRQQLLSEHKHFTTSSDERNNGNKDMAARIPCPIEHPRGRFLDEDVAYEEDLEVTYAIPSNGMAPEDRPLHTPRSKELIRVVTEGVTSKKKQGQTIVNMASVESKVFDRLEGGKKPSKDLDEAEIDGQFLQLASSICGAQHWTTHFMTLDMVEETLAALNETLMNLGRDPRKDEESMEEMFVSIAEAADDIERAYTFAKNLNLKLDPAHWLFDYTLALARVLVGLGDAKSQKYASEWVSRVDKYAAQFENEGMQKVVVALRDAWKRDGSDGKRKAETKSDENKKLKSG